jgi:hypothetical protein
MKNPMGLLMENVLGNTNINVTKKDKNFLNNTGKM